MFVYTFSSGPFDTRGYLVADLETKEAFLIDAPPFGTPLYLEKIEALQLKVKALLLTHSHLDHIADAAELALVLSIPVWIHPLDAPNLERPGSDGLPLFFEIPPWRPERLLKGGELLYLGELSFEVIETPGHTPGGVSFYVKKEKTLFSGDTLFKGTIGNLSFPKAEPEKMWDSLKRLSKLPKETLVYPGHGASTTIGAESWMSEAKNYFS